MTKKDQYIQLVQKRKSDNYSHEFGYKNQSIFPDFDHEEIGNFTMWANDLDAHIMVIAQDYCNVETFQKCKGLIQEKPFQDANNIKEWEVPTNYFLWQLLKCLNRDIGLPIKGQTKQSGVFLTNAVLDLKPGKMSAKNKNKVNHHSGENYLKPLVSIIEPLHIITLGVLATQSLLKLYADETPAYKSKSSQSMTKLFEEGSFAIRNGATTVHPVYHPSRLGQSGRCRIETSKSMDGFSLMKKDWGQILKTIS